MNLPITTRCNRAGNACFDPAFDAKKHVIPTRKGLCRLMSKRRKKTFSCGHKGYGQICHRCAQAVALQEQDDRVRAEKRQEKIDWEASFSDDPIDLTALPQHVVLKSRSIIAALNSKHDYREFGGKRLRHDRQIISIPITRNYRMICHDENGTTVPHAVLSHEDYNVKKPGG
jgi:hypothetical protein